MIDTTERSPLGGHDHGSSLTAILKSKLQLVHDIASQIQIGPYDNLISLSTFDRSVHKQWNLDDYTTKDDLLHKLINVHEGVRYGPHGDLNSAVQYLVDHVMDDDHGDRDAFPNDVIIITDANSVFSSDTLKRSLQHKSHDVIIISVGTSASTSGTVADLATDSAHVIHVPSYANLSQITGQLLQLLCV